MSNLPPEGRRYLRGAAQEQDQSKAHRGFLLSQAHEDAKTSKEKRAAADRRRASVKMVRTYLLISLIRSYSLPFGRIENIKIWTWIR